MTFLLLIWWLSEKETYAHPNRSVYNTMGLRWRNNRDNPFLEKDKADDDVFTKSAED
jgi:hypothetical protein